MLRGGGPNLDLPPKDIVDGRNPANQWRLVAYPMIYRALYIPGGAGFLPPKDRFPGAHPTRHFTVNLRPFFGSLSLGRLFGQETCLGVGGIRGFTGSCVETETTLGVRNRIWPRKSTELTKKMGGGRVYNELCCGGKCFGTFLEVVGLIAAMNVLLQWFEWQEALQKNGRNSIRLLWNALDLFADKIAANREHAMSNSSCVKLFGDLLRYRLDVSSMDTSSCHKNLR